MQELALSAVPVGTEARVAGCEQNRQQSVWSPTRKAPLAPAWTGA